MDDKIIFYTIDCPKCQILKRKMDNKNIQYEIINNKKIIIKKGISQLPMLEIKGHLLNYKGGVDYINKL